MSGRMKVAAPPVETKVHNIFSLLDSKKKSSKKARSLRLEWSSRLDCSRAAPPGGED